MRMCINIPSLGFVAIRPKIDFYTFKEQDFQEFILYFQMAYSFYDIICKKLLGI